MQAYEPTALESPSVLVVHTGGTEPGGSRAVDDADGYGAELTVAFPGQRSRVREQENAEERQRGLVAVGDVLVSVDGGTPDFSAPVAVDAITDPTDLSAIGVAVSRFCNHWATVDRLVVSVRSLDRLLRYATPEQVFRFVHALIARLEHVGAVTHVYFDRSRHDEHLVTIFGTLFDEIVVEDASEPLAEATDETVAEVLAAADWNRPAEAATDAAEPLSEATDEEIARRLEY